ncbi:MAG: glycosyltransferase [Fibrobacteraceae bacterium]|nr:glycosyltransferase [Fibrobacteraceae bacterium]
MDKSKYSCSIIIIAYNSCDFIPACLKSIRDAVEGIDAQIIVMDNGSKEPILPEIKSFFPEVLWLDSKENLGFGKGCNLAEKSAVKPYLFFINPDTVISKDAFVKMLDFMTEHPDAGTVGCRILNEDGSIQWACRRSFPTPISAISKTIGLAHLFPKNKMLASYNMTYADPDQEIEVDAISGSFFCINRELFEKLNGFDEDYFMYGEDLDLCFRTKSAGYRNYYTPATNILHFKGQSCRTRRWKSYVDFYQAMLIFVKKHKKLYVVPYFLVSFGVFFAALVGMFSRLMPKFWKIFIDLFVMLVVASATYIGLEHLEGREYAPQMVDGIPFVAISLVNVIFLIFSGEYASSSLQGRNFFTYLMPLNILAIGLFCFFWNLWPLYMVLAVLNPLCLIVWRRVAFWINYFYRIFAKKRHRSILLGGSEDSLQSWFDRYNVIPGVEILGCVSNKPENVSAENRLHLLGNLSEMESICNRTGCRELLIVSNFSGYSEPYDIEWLEKLKLKVYLLIGNGQNGDFALVNLKYLH